MPDLKKEFISLGKTLGAIIATLTALWFFGEPFLEDYVESHFDTYELKHEEENSKKVKLRNLLSDKMGVAPDEVHIELGRMYQSEKPENQKLWDAINADYKENKDIRNRIIRDIQYIYPGTNLNID
jgi:hypothetical protein